MIGINVDYSNITTVINKNLRYYKVVALILVALLNTLQTYSQVQANFTAMPLSGCAPLLVNYTSTSTGSPVSYLWDLGNGTQSTIQNPSATYFNSGLYTITLIATSANGAKDTLTRTNYIEVFAKPVVNFKASDSVGCYPLTTQFTDLSTAVGSNIVTWQWDFGDGSSATTQNPIHTYPQGTFTVVLRVTTDKGCTTTYVKNNYIKAQFGVQSGFNFISPNTCSTPVTINFNNTATGTGILNYAWNFGDGSTATTQNPTHTYTTNGSYNVTLLVTNNQGCTSTYTLNNAVSIGNNTAAFTAPDSVCVNVPVGITNTSAPSPGSSIWNFGDGTTSNLNNPTKIYTVAGNYTIKLIANFGACKDSVSKNITVLEKPMVTFVGSDTVSCKPPLTVTFTSNASSGVTYAWNFGDGNTSTLQNPTNTYNTTGQFTVTLTVTNAFGCVNTFTRTNYIKITAPSVNFINLPDSGCRPLTVMPQYTANVVDGIASYQWNFGDGFTTNAANPSHTYNTAGTFSITLIITTNGGCKDSVTSFVKVGTKPSVQFSATPLITCALTPVAFTDLTVGGPLTSWYWTFGDGGTSIEQNPAYQYQDTGFFSITLIVGSNGCYDTLTKIGYIYIKPPVAKFIKGANCTTPLTYNFTDQSIAPLTWLWNFGDGNTSTLQNPNHTYATPGNYNISLTVTNGTCSHTKPDTVRVIDENAQFTANQLIVCKNTVIDFTSTNYIRSNISTIKWDFGDGSIVIGDSLISHTYTQSGVYTVKLIMTDLNGCIDTFTRLQYITVFGPTANFASAVPGSCLNSAVVFNDLSTTDGTHPLLTWQWNYGDGTIQSYTAPPFVHQYIAQGAYSVSLKVIDNFGCVDSINKPNYFIISKPVADFNTPDTVFCPNVNLQFTNASTGPSLQYIWYFGDGQTSTATNPVHQYANDGMYTVKLHVTDQYGCMDSITKVQYVLIATPQANFAVSDSFSTCPPLFVQFTNNSINYTSTNWDFGDGSVSNNLNPTHFYTSPGTFIAKLTITTNGGCISIYTRTIIVKGPSGTLSYTPLQGCNPLTISLSANTSNATNYVWDFNNGQTVSTTSSAITYTYTAIGKYLPRIILKDDAGCSIPVLGLDSVTVYGVDNTLASSSTLLCDSGVVAFTATPVTLDVINSYLWNFGDGNTATAQNPTHNYTTNGNYTIQCIVTTQQGCKDTTTLQVPINIIKSPQIAVTGPIGNCIPATAQFNTNIIYNDSSALSWNWNFGNGQNNTNQNPPPITYNTAGAYIVTNIVTNSSGCKDTATLTYNAYALPVVSAGGDVQICRSTPTQLLATGASSYVWSLGTGLSCTNCNNPLANPDSTTIYAVTGTDINNCVAKDTVQVKVIQPFVMTQSPGTALCLGKSITLVATGANSYQWSPGIGLSSTTAPTVVAKPTVTTNYRVIGSDAFNCFKDTGFINVIINPIPTVNAGNDITIIGGATAQINTTTTGGVTNYTWSPTATLSCINCPNPISKPIATTTYTVDVVNSGGCKAQDEITVFVLCDKGNLFVPNTFSPNGDGMNDVLYPRGNGIYGIKTFKIFDRWGELVFEKNNFSANDAAKGWDGTYKGKKAQPDVFVYIIEVFCENGNALSFKGNITVVH